MSVKTESVEVVTLYSHDQRQSNLKDIRFHRLKRVPWVLFQGIVLWLSCMQVKGNSNKD